MVIKLKPQPSTHFSQKKGGVPLGSWQQERVFLAEKTCPHCGIVFRPKILGKTGKYVPERVWNKRIYCSISCKAKHNNPMSAAENRRKMRDTLLRIKHAPITRGGNGRLLPLPQLALLHALGEGWRAELAVITGAGHRNGVYPNCYKLDIGNEETKIGIELDGGTHCGKRLLEDQKKDDLLKSLGWKVLRITNERALYLYSTYTSVATLLTSLMES